MEKKINKEYDLIDIIMTLLEGIMVGLFIAIVIILLSEQSYASTTVYYGAIASPFVVTVGCFSSSQNIHAGVNIDEIYSHYANRSISQPADVFKFYTDAKGLVDSCTTMYYSPYIKAE